VSSENHTRWSAASEVAATCNVATNDHSHAGGDDGCRSSSQEGEKCATESTNAAAINDQR